MLTESEVLGPAEIRRGQRGEEEEPAKESGQEPAASKEEDCVASRSWAERMCQGRMPWFSMLLAKKKDTGFTLRPGGG